MNIKGYKMDGLGNDFLILDQRSDRVNLNKDQIKHLANRNNIGFDQLITINSEKNSIPKILFFNSDGGRISACGNGSRCVSYFLMQEKKINEILIDTVDRILHCTILEGKNVKIDMGKPIFDWKKIPLAREEDINNIKIKISEYGEFEGSALSIGNPHIIFFQEIEIDKLKILGPLIENYNLFPERCNVTFAKIIDKKNIKINVWERGAGLTLACGTAACATLIASVQKKLSDRLVDIHFSNGSLKLELDFENRVYMTGPVSEIKDIIFTI